jgi:hypothetical protein
LATIIPQTQVYYNTQPRDVQRSASAMGLISDISSHLALTLVGLVILTYCVRTIYSVFLGPLAKFPGPKLAAATLLYEFYYDVICKGQYTWKIKELHQQYGR